MALWKDNPKLSPSAVEPMPLPRAEPMPAATPKPEAPPIAAPIARAPVRDNALAESLIAPDIAIEGKIEGSGHVRIAGRFKGDVNVRGNLTIEPRAEVTGSLRADKVIIAGDLIGNIEAASHVELVQSGSLTGDLKAGSLSVAAGARMRGNVDFGWEGTKSSDVPRKGNGSDNGGA